MCDKTRSIQGTSFAPAGRLNKTLVEDQTKLLDQSLAIEQMLNIFPDMALVLNECRQVVFSNKSFCESVGISEPQSITGLRPGEILSCRYADCGEDGCGSSEYCEFCGAVNAIWNSQKKKARVVNGCQILTKDDDAIDIEVRVEPITIREQDFSLVFIKDIGDEKRREFLERAFFHDILNTAGALNGLSQYLTEECSNCSQLDTLEMLCSVSKSVIDEIEAHRDILRAEDGLVEVNETIFGVGPFLNELVHNYTNNTTMECQKIALKDGSFDGKIKTDQTLLGRVLRNMIKNALEASEPSDLVTVSCDKEGDEVVFNVHNRGFMPVDVQMQIFKRSFSTKAEKGRGIGTHSMKLIGERHLKGQVDFASSEDNGTVFSIRLKSKV